MTEDSGKTEELTSSTEIDISSTVRSVCADRSSTYCIDADPCIGMPSVPAFSIVIDCKCWIEVAEDSASLLACVLRSVLNTELSDSNEKLYQQRQYQQ